jgi:hypothetical protein
MTVQAPPGTAIYESAEAPAQSVAAWVCRQAQASGPRLLYVSPAARRHASFTRPLPQRVPGMAFLGRGALVLG